MIQNMNQNENQPKNNQKSTVNSVEVIEFGKKF